MNSHRDRRFSSAAARELYCSTTGLTPQLITEAGQNNNYELLSDILINLGLSTPGSRPSIAEMQELIRNFMGKKDPFLALISR